VENRGFYALGSTDTSFASVLAMFFDKTLSATFSRSELLRCFSAHAQEGAVRHASRRRRPRDGHGDKQAPQELLTDTSKWRAVV
jgi:hypothetical protein